LGSFTSERTKCEQWLTILKELATAEARVEELEASQSYQYGTALREHYERISLLPVNVMSETELFDHLAAPFERQKPIVGLRRKAAVPPGKWELYP
jgi:hypothetical protein